MISVIIPCYNASSTLGVTIESALSQSSVEKEIIVVDDGSTDQSADIINSFKGAIIAEFGVNEGVSAARNRGTSVAKGEYIQYLDADDILMPGTLNKRVEALEKSGADIAYTDWGEFANDAAALTKNTAVVVHPIETLAADAEAACATSRFWAPPAAILYRRWVVDAVGGWNTRLPIVQDARFLFDAARVGGRFIRVESVGALYRVSPDSLSRKTPHKFVRDCFVNTLEIEAIWNDDERLSETKRRALIEMWGHLTAVTFRTNMPEFKESLRHLKNVSDRQHFAMQARYLLSLFFGQSTVSQTEQMIRTWLKPLRQCLFAKQNSLPF